MGRRAAGLACTLALAAGLASPAGAAGTERSSTIAAPQSRTVYIDQDHVLWSWGRRSGLLGDGSELSVAGYPRAIMSNAVAVSTDGSQTAVIDGAGGLWYWGNNACRCLGLDAGGTTVPVKVRDNVKSVVVYEDSMAVIDRNDTLWMCGGGAPGTRDRVGPFVKVMEHAANAAVNGDFSMAVDQAGDLWFWGQNAFGMIRDVEPHDDGYDDWDEYIYQPIRVRSGVRSVTLSYKAIAYIDSQNDLWLQGYSTGQLMDQEKVYYPASVVRPAVKVGENVRSVSLNDFVGAYVDWDGGLWTWGSNGNGELGDGTTESRPRPQKIMDGIVAADIEEHGAALDREGNLWCWGFDRFGQTMPGTVTGNYMSGTDTRATPRVAVKGVVAAPGAPAPAAAGAVGIAAAPTAVTVIVDGKAVSMAAYNIANNNYFKLRDVASVLSGTNRQFDVGWNSLRKTIELTTGTAYTPVGGELTAGAEALTQAVPSPTILWLDDEVVDLAAYTIGENNYFKLRDIGRTLRFHVTWDAGRGAIVVDTHAPYDEQS